MNIKPLIIGTGHYSPPQVLDNSKLADDLGVTEDWIYSRTGIESRRISHEYQNTSELALYASLNAIEEANINPEEIDMIIVCTLSPDKLCPSTACILQNELKAFNAACFDLEAACAGFIFGLTTAYQYIYSGMYKTILVVGADILSRFTDYNDKSTSILFGDGAGAAIIRAGEEESFKAFNLGSDGSLKDMIHIPSSGVEKSDLKPFLILKGREVFKWAINNVPQIIIDTLKKANMSLTDIDYFIIHQANQRITKAVTEKLSLPIEKVLSNIEDIGNTSAASIPILLSHAVKTGKIKKGHKILMVGFGSGMSWGATIFEWKL